MSESQLISGMASGAVLHPLARVIMGQGEPEGFGVRKGQREDGGQRYRKYLS